MFEKIGCWCMNYFELIETNISHHKTSVVEMENKESIII